MVKLITMWILWKKLTFFQKHCILGYIKKKTFVTFEKDDFKNLKHGHLTMSHYCYNQNTLYECY
jgi:hypothetical protein